MEVELCLGKQISATFMKTHGELAQRVAKMRRKFAKQYGFVVPEIRLSDELAIPPKSYQIKIHGTMVASEELRIGDVLVITGDGPRPDIPGDEAREPAFGMKAMWVSEMFVNEVKREGFKSIDNMSVLLTHLREVIRNNLAQLLSYKDVRALLDRLEPEYRRLLEEIAPSQISYSGIQAVLKLLLAERISIRNLHLILEAIAEIAPHVRRAEALVEHVRMRLAPQICGDLAEGGVLKVLRLGNRWDLAFHQSLQARCQGRCRRVRYRSPPDRAVQHGGHQGHPRAHGPGPPVRARRRAGCAALRADGDGAAVCDAARSVARGDRPRRAGQVAGHDLMSPIGPDTILLVFLLFCRIGGCLMLMPGVSSARVPVNVRLFIAPRRDLGIDALCSRSSCGRSVADKPSSVMLTLIVSEVAVGAMIGIMARVFFLALQFMATGMAMFIGFSTCPARRSRSMSPRRRWRP